MVDNEEGQADSAFFGVAQWRDELKLNLSAKGF